MNSLKMFLNEKFGEVRTTLISDQPYFCLADLCRILEIKNISDCKERLKKDGVVNTEVIDALGRKQKANFINESNLYKVIFQSRKPEAEKFQDWVTEEVLPEIRKTGAYSKAPKSFKEALYLAYKQQEQIEYLEKTKAWIGSRREATAMATASAKTREVNKLKEVLDLEMSYATVKKVEKASERKFDWRKLKEYCTSAGLGWNRVYDANYGSVNSYPSEAWKNVYGIDLKELF